MTVEKNNNSLKHISYKLNKEFSIDGVTLSEKKQYKAITPTNHNRSKQCDEPIGKPIGKIARTRGDWWKFCFSLAEKLTGDFL